MTTMPLDATQSVEPEVASYVRSRGTPLIASLVVIPLIAAVAAGWVVSQRPPTYQSTLRIVVPQELSNSASGIGLYLANLELRLRDPEVVSRVTDKTGVDARAYATGIALTRVGQSSSADFSFAASRPDVAASVVETAASAALESLASQELPFAESELELADESYRRAVTELNAFRDEHGVAFPEEQYRQTVTELEGVQADLAEAEAAGDSAAVARLEAVVAELTGTQDTLSALLPEYERLDDARIVALELRSRARDRLASNQTKVRLTTPEYVRRDITTIELSHLRPVVQSALAAAGIALFVLLIVFVLPDLLRRDVRRPVAHRRR